MHGRSCCFLSFDYIQDNFIRQLSSLTKLNVMLPIHALQSYKGLFCRPLILTHRLSVKLLSAVLSGVSLPDLTVSVCTASLPGCCLLCFLYSLLLTACLLHPSSYVFFGKHNHSSFHEADMFIISVHKSFHSQDLIVHNAAGLNHHPDCRYCTVCSSSASTISLSRGLQNTLEDAVPETKQASSGRCQPARP